MVPDREAVAALFEEAAAGVVVLSADGVVVVNRAARLLLGLGDTVALKDLPGAALARAALGGRPAETAVVDVAGADGQRALLATWTPIRDAGHVTAAIGVYQDATALAHREHRLHEMLAHVAHELRTPLTPILGWARMLLQKQPVEPTVQRAAEVIERNVRLEVRLVDDLLDLSRLQRGILPLDRKPVDVRDACRAAVEEIRGLLAARSLTLAEQHATDPLWVEGDPVRLQQLVISLSIAPSSWPGTAAWSR
jgi:signal transduction histidine kinase